VCTNGGALSDEETSLGILSHTRLREEFEAAGFREGVFSADLKSTFLLGVP
jgi:hypothetical protein